VIMSVLLGSIIIGMEHVFRAVQVPWIIILQVQRLANTVFTSAQLGNFYIGTRHAQLLVLSLWCNRRINPSNFVLIPARISSSCTTMELAQIIVWILLSKEEKMDMGSASFHAVNICFGTKPVLEAVHLPYLLSLVYTERNTAFYLVQAHSNIM